MRTSCRNRVGRIEGGLATLVLLGAAAGPVAGQQDMSQVEIRTIELGERPLHADGTGREHRAVGR